LQPWKAISNTNAQNDSIWCLYLVLINIDLS
jgi:hypothetical protein